MKAIGIAYQMHGLVCLDAEMNVLRPSIIWCDSRAVEIGREAFEAIGAGAVPVAAAQLAGQLHGHEARLGQAARAGSI